MVEQNRETELTLLKRLIDRENYFAYATDGHTSLREVLVKEENLTKTRLDAERALEEKFRVNDPTNQDDVDILLEEEKAQIWDLREMLEREEP